MPPNLEAVRADLRKKTAYLADGGRNVLDNLMWYKTENFDRVVARDAADSYDNEYTVYSQSQSQGGEARAPAEAPPAPPAATLSAIVRLSNYKYFLTACSDWQPGVTDKILPLKDARPSAIAEDPGLPAIAEDFKAAWEALDELTKDIVPDEKVLLQSIGLIDRSKPHYSGFRVGHKVFEKKEQASQSSSANSDDGDSDTNNSEPEFTVENWPLTYLDAQKHLDKLNATHNAKPIPAYNLTGHLIRPTQYKAELKGAIIRLEFHLNHRHVFTADITRIRVLAPPPPFDTPTPKRKRLPKVDDFYSDEDANDMPPTPSKKAKRQSDAVKSAAQNVLSSIRKT